jgi:hypothetical protein
MTPAGNSQTPKAPSVAAGGKVEKRPHWLLLYGPPVAVFIGAMFHHHVF